MIVELIKTFNFEAAHFLHEAPHGHKCRRIHGHSFICRVQIKGEVDEKTGWLQDYGELKNIIEPVRLQLDHHFLNQDIPDLANATSENICRWIWRRLKPSLPLLSAVTLDETCMSRCVYRGE
jgi:6-pyruvoyltetrahydropterin/6-carboxytetrahydropterin synthase